MDKEQLLKLPALDQQAQVEISVGTITIRALSQGEVTRANDDKRLTDRLLLSYSMVDPAMSYMDVCQWADCAVAGDIVKVLAAVRDLSGLGEDARKSGAEEDGDRP